MTTQIAVLIRKLEKRRRKAHEHANECIGVDDAQDCYWQGVRDGLGSALVELREYEQRTTPRG